MNNTDPIKASKDLSVTGALILGLILAIFSFNLTTDSVLLSSISLIVAIYGVYVTAKSKKLLAILLVVGGITMFAAPLETLDVTILTVSAYACLIGGMAIGGVLMSRKGKFAFIAVAAFAVAYAAACVYTKEPIVSLSALMPLAGAVGMAVCSSKKLPRTTAVCVLTAVFLAVSYLPDVILLIVEHGSAAMEQVRAAIEETKTVLGEAMYEAAKAIGGEESELYSRETVLQLIDTVFNILPAISVIMASVMSFISQSFFFSLSAAYGAAHTEEELTLSPQKTSAWMFFISLATMFITSLFSGYTMEVLSVSMMNLNLILLPVFALINVASIIRAFKQKRLAISPITLIIIFFLAMNIGALLLYPLAAQGAISVIKRHPKPIGEAESDK